MTVSIALRPYLPSDAEALALIYQAAILELTGDDYSERQQEEWAAEADDVDEFGVSLASMLTLIAVEKGEAIGFASLKGADHVEMLFVHPSAARRGVGSALLDALERIAGARGAKALTTEASDTSQPLFARRGYQPVRRNTTAIGDEWFGTTTMTKKLAPVEPAGTLQ
ncbi:MAG: GNAT family N-acetyltransferase [Labrys sp. (in: a-proteobacteria)]|jgi:putative acetyltransferase